MCFGTKKYWHEAEDFKEKEKCVIKTALSVVQIEDEWKIIEKLKKKGKGKKSP